MDAHILYQRRPNVFSRTRRAVRVLLVRTYSKTLLVQTNLPFLPYVRTHVPILKVDTGPGEVAHSHVLLVKTSCQLCVVPTRVHPCHPPPGRESVEVEG